MYFYLDTSPLTAAVDFNMTDSRGVVPALRKYMAGLVPDQLVRGLPVIVQDADGNTSPAVVYSISADVIEMFLLPAPVDVVSPDRDSFVPPNGEYPPMSEPADEPDPDFRAQPDLVR